MKLLFTLFCAACACVTPLSAAPTSPPTNSQYRLVTKPYPFYPAGWRLHPKVKELIKGKNIKSAIEVGSFAGRNTMYLAKVLPSTTKIYAVDPWDYLIQKNDKYASFYKEPNWMSQVLDANVKNARIFQGYKEDRRFFTSSMPKYEILEHKENLGETIHMGGGSYYSSYYAFLSNMKHADLESRVIPVKKSITEAPKTINFKPDFIYMTAAKMSCSGMTSEIKPWLKKLALNGIICGDNFDYPCVRRSVEAVAKEFNLKVEFDGAFWWLIKA